MIDFIKIEELSNRDQIRDLLDFGVTVIERTGEMPVRKSHATMRGLTFTLTPGGRFMKVQGSVHKFSNGGERNNDRFTFDRFMQVADDLRDYISPEDRVNVIEIGLNIKTPFPPGQFLKNLISHKKDRFNRYTLPEQDRAEVPHSQYRVKIYDKGLQQGGENVLRVEIRVNKMQFLRGSFPNGLTWGDLQKPENWVTFGQYLIGTFKEVVYYDPTVKRAILTPSELKIIEEGNNPIYWENLKGGHQERQRIRFQNLIMKHGTKFNTIGELLSEELARVLPRKVAEIYQNANPDIDTLKTGHFSEVAEIYPLLDCKNPPPPIPIKICPVTGVDISMQKPDSKFLCVSGLKELMKTDPGKFKKLRDERLSRRWYCDTDEVQLREIAHSIRNEYFNPRNNTRRAVEKIMTRPALFDSMPYIRVEARVYLEG